MKLACGRCTGAFNAPIGVIPVCPHGAVLTAVPEHVPVTGCLHDVANFRLLPIRSKRHFVPRSGRGKFDCAYNPTDGSLDITVKLNLTTTAKWFYQSEGFTAEQLQAMKNDFAQNVPRLWNGKWVFQCRKAGFGLLPNVTPRFRIEFGAQEAHFTLIISQPDHAAAQNVAPGMRNCRGFVSINQIKTNDPTVQDRVELQDFHIQDFQHTLAPQMIAQFERERLERVVRAVGEAATVGNERWIFVAFDGMGDPQRILLRAFATTGMDRLAGTPQIPIVVAGVARANELAGKARERAQAVAQVLTQAGLDNPVQYAPDVVADRTGARIRIDTAFEDNVPTLTYNVAAHEFGHMIGLPDEYENPVSSPNGTPDNNAKAIAKTNYINLCGAAGIPAPVFDSRTVSMMSYGMSVMRFHTVTIWDALCFLTAGIIAPNEWEATML